MDHADCAKSRRLGDKPQVVSDAHWSIHEVSAKLHIMKQLFATLLLALIPAALAAQSPMTAQEFEEYVTGRTLTYADRGVIYGIEEYLPNRRVRWAFTADECRDGYWYDAEGEICFVYEGNPDPQCWTFTRRGGRLSALFTGAEDGRELYEAQQSDKPLVCLGPDVGV